MFIFQTVIALIHFSAEIRNLPAMLNTHVHSQRVVSVLFLATAIAGDLLVIKEIF